jgi:NADPH:quinone reductase-like Zn-dependent oxidoreductase
MLLCQAGAGIKCGFLQVSWQILHRSSTKAGSVSNRTRRIHQLLVTETRKAESPFSTLLGDQNTLPLIRKGRFVTMSAQPPAPGIAAAMPALCLPPPPYSPSNPFPASSLSYSPSIPTPLPTSHPTLFILKVYATALTRDELTWSETLSPQRRTPAIPGHDVCGTIVALPANYAISDTAEGPSPRFKVGDEVFALVSFSRDGAAAGYCLAAEEELALKPRNLGREEAASIPLSALTAWQAFFEHGGLADPTAPTTSIPSDARRILIIGVSGGVGVMALQIAKATTASTGVGYVAGTCSGRNASFVKSLGADKVVDYTSHPHLADGFTVGKAPFDMILDTVGAATLEQCCSPALIRNGGRVVSVAMPLSDERKKALGLEGRGVDCVFFVVRPDGKQLAKIGKLVEAGGLKGVVQEVFKLEKGMEAMELVESSRVRGKVVLKVE